jgi:transcriptional regulator with XRE-family HTH domain
MGTPGIEPLYAQLGARIKEIREHLGLSQTQLGELLSPPVGRQHIHHIEKGIQRIQVHTLVQIARVMGCSVDYLVGNLD